MPFAPDARGDSFKELILTFYSPKRILCAKSPNRKRKFISNINDHLGLKPTVPIVTTDMQLV